MSLPRKLLFSLEKSLLAPEIRGDAAALARLLSDDFLEIGASGRVYDKKNIVDRLPSEAKRRFGISALKMRRLAPGCCLITYHLREGGRVSRRSSIWVLRGGKWKMTFHQGTVVS